MADIVWIQERITRTKVAIVRIEDAIEALTAGAQSYTLDTGQTRQTVTKANLSELMRALTEYEKRLVKLTGDLSTAEYGGSSGYVRPGF